MRELCRLADEGEKTTTSSQELGKRLGISSAQIRKDLSRFGEFGKQGTGYHINYLINQLRQILHLTEEWPVVLIGAGYLGHALAHYHGFQHRGFRVVRVFDNDPVHIGKIMNGVKVQDVKELYKSVLADQIKIAILTVPTEAAQEITDILVEAGVTSILTYAPIQLKAPSFVNISYSDPVIQLQQMAYYLRPQSEQS